MTAGRDKGIGPNLMVGVIAAGAVAAAGMFAWYWLTITTEREFGYAAWGLGVLVGFVTLKAARQPSVVLGVIAAGCAGVAILGGGYLATSYFFEHGIAEVAREQFPKTLQNARLNCDAKTDGEKRQRVAEINCEDGKDPEPNEVSATQLEEFEKVILPKSVAIVEGRTSADQYAAQMAKDVRSAIPRSEVLKMSLSLWTALWLLLGVCSAFAIAAQFKKS